MQFAERIHRQVRAVPRGADLALLDDIIRAGPPAERSNCLNGGRRGQGLALRAGQDRMQPRPAVLPGRVRGHVRRKPAARQCKGLLGLTIDTEKCKGCGLCAQVPGERHRRREKAAYRIDQSKCLKCGACEGPASSRRSVGVVTQGQGSGFRKRLMRDGSRA